MDDWLWGAALQAFKSPASIVTVETLPIVQVIVGAPSGRTLNWQQMPSGLARSWIKFSSHVAVFFCLTVTTSPCQQDHFPPLMLANKPALWVDARPTLIRAKPPADTEPPDCRRQGGRSPRLGDFYVADADVHYDGPQARRLPAGADSRPNQV